MKKQARKVVDIATKRSVKVRNAVRYVGNERLAKRFVQMTKNNKQDEKTVVFLSFMGRGYSDSPLAIYRQMVNDPYFEDWKFVWAFKKSLSVEFNAKRELAESLALDPSVKVTNKTILSQYTRATTVAYNSPEYYEALSKAKYWVSNSRIQEGVWPGENHTYIQTWHGTPLKRLGADLDYSSNALYNTKQIAVQYREEGEKIDYMLSPSDFYTEKISSAFVITDASKAKILQEGYPRNDFLASHTKSDVDRIKQKLGIDEKKKVLLYAPTWRDDQYDLKKGYTYELGADFDKLQKDLGDEWVILFRAHYFIANNFDFSKYEGFVYDTSNHPDINELYVVSDCLMTDYSSVFFDFAVLQRPILFFMYDREQYAGELRGFYLDLEELPGDILEKNEEVIDRLQKIGAYSKKHHQDLKKFKERFCSMDDGKASTRVIDAIFKKKK